MLVKVDAFKVILLQIWLILSSRKEDDVVKCDSIEWLLTDYFLFDNLILYWVMFELLLFL